MRKQKRCENKERWENKEDEKTKKDEKTKISGNSIDQLQNTDVLYGNQLKPIIPLARISVLNEQ